MMTPQPSRQFDYNQLVALNERIEQLEKLVHTVSRGKYTWEATFDAITDPVMVISRDYSILRTNLAAAAAADIDVRQMIGARCYVTLAGRETPCPACPMPQAHQNHKANSGSLDPFPRSGRQYYVNAYPLKDSPYDTQSTVLHYRDISEEKALQQKLIQSEKMAAVGTLAGGVAHEINNPLGGILAFTELVIKQLPSEHACQEDLGEIHDATLRCKQIVQDLLDFSRTPSNQAFEALDVNDVISKVLPLVKVQDMAGGITVRKELTSPLPAIQGHFNRLQQVFLNLITNAFQAMHGRSGVLTIRTGTDTDQGQVWAEVEDTGDGITDELIDKIFDPFFTTKKPGKGTGLGLAISYGIIQEHGGHIGVESRPQEGTKFRVVFPAVQGLASL